MSIKNIFMESTKSYYLYKLEEKYDGQDWMPVIPKTYSIDGNGTMPRMLKSDYEEVCDNNDYSAQYLTIESLEDGNTIKWVLASQSSRTISASTDYGATWTEYTSTSGNGTTIATLNTGQKVFLKGLESSFSGNCFRTSKQYKVYGNIMSLVSGDTFDSATELTDAFTFSSLFSGSTSLIDAENLILPATTLTEYCYAWMFAACRNLTMAPELPAMTMVRHCYDGMFRACTSLTTAPELPATTLAERCYQNMFYNCSGLISAPSILPATTLAEGCYKSMFERCTSLVNAPELPAMTMTQQCYEDMFANCTSLTTAPELPATTLAITCYGLMFAGCTSLTTAPELPATELAGGCYRQMFDSCTSLTMVPELPAPILVESCYWYMFQYCSSLVYIKCLATDISASACTNGWVKDVSASGVFVKAPNMTGWGRHENGIPVGWTVQNA